MSHEEVTAVSTTTQGTSLFTLGLPNAKDGHGFEGSQVWSKFFSSKDGDGGWSGWFALSPNTFPSGGAVTALCTRPGKTNLYVVVLPNAEDGDST